MARYGNIGKTVAEIFMSLKKPGHRGNSLPLPENDIPWEISSNLLWTKREHFSPLVHGNSFCSKVSTPLRPHCRPFFLSISNICLLSYSALDHTDYEHNQTLRMSRHTCSYRRFWQSLPIACTATERSLPEIAPAPRGSNAVALSVVTHAPNS